MTSLAPIAEKLAKFIRLLTSDKDGEVVAAAHAIKRTLERAKLDIHALAEGIGATPANGKKFSEEEAAEIYRHGVAEGRRAAEQSQPTTFHNVNGDDGRPWHEIACASAAKSERLRDQKERDFVADMVRWTVRDREAS
jgi:hypothetical protein